MKLAAHKKLTKTSRKYLHVCKAVTGRDDNNTKVLIQVVSFYKRFSD